MTGPLLPPIATGIPAPGTPRVEPVRRKQRSGDDEAQDRGQGGGRRRKREWPRDGDDVVDGDGHVDVYA